MKFTKFIPLALALTLAVPAFADPVTLQNNYDINVPVHFSITEKTGTVKSGTGVIAEAAADGALSLSYTPAMKVTYRVVNNDVDKVFYVKGTVGTTTINALTGTAPSLKIALGNTTVAPTSEAVTNALGSASEDGNSNVFALSLTSSVSTLIGDTDLAQPSVEGTKYKYIAQPGTYEVGFTFGTEALAGTFSSRDTQGTYRAVLTITDSAS